MSFYDRILERIGAKYNRDKMTIDDGFVSAEALNTYFDKTISNSFARTFYSSEIIDYDLIPHSRRKTNNARTIDLVMVSSALSIGYDGAELVGERFEDLRTILVPNPTPKIFNRTGWNGHRVSELSDALKNFKGSENCPDIICFPEFSYPPPLETRTYARMTTANSEEEKLDYLQDNASAVARDRAIRNTYFDRTSYGRNRENFETKILEELRDKNDPFVLMGTFHCPFDYYNTGVVFPMGGDIESRDVRLATRTKGKSGHSDPVNVKINPPLLYRKKFPSRRLEEYIRVPSNNDFQTFVFKDIHIAVVICSDVLDLNQVYNFARLKDSRKNSRPIDIILVPTYNYSNEHVSMCRELSFLTNSFVVMVNANDKLRNENDDRRDVKKLGDSLNSDVFLSGFSISDFKLMSQLDVSPINLVDTVICSNSDSMLHQIRLNLDARDEFVDRITKVREDSNQIGLNIRAASGSNL